MALNGLFCADVPLKNYSLTLSGCKLRIAAVFTVYIGLPTYTKQIITELRQVM